MRVIVMGCGRVGARVASALAREGHEVTIFDVNPESFRRLPEHPNLTALVADGRQQDDLRRVGLEGADAFVAASSRDTANALAAQVAHHLFHIPKVVCRIYDPARQELYTSLGLTALSPTNLISDMILKAVRP